MHQQNKLNTQTHKVMEKTFVIRFKGTDGLMDSTFVTTTKIEAVAFDDALSQFRAIERFKNVAITSIERC